MALASVLTPTPNVVPARRLRGLAHVSEKESANAAHHCRQNVKELAALHRSLEAAVDAFEAAARAATLGANEPG